MTPPSPYGPDRSLLVATGVLLGGCLVVAGALYVLTAFTDDMAWGRQTQLVDVQMGRKAYVAQRRFPHRRSPAAGSVPSGAFRTGMTSPALAGGRVPAWAEPEQAPPPLRPSTRESYDLRADLGHAQLGLPSASASDSGPAAGTVHSGPKGSGPKIGRAPLTVDLGRSSLRAGRAWQTEFSQLNGRLRALDGALAHLDRPQGASTGAVQTQGVQQNAPRTTARGQSATSNAAPSLPKDPSQVPVGGGLGWLAAGGAAYAVRRLRIRSEEEGNA